MPKIECVGVVVVVALKGAAISAVVGVDDGVVRVDAAVVPVVVLLQHWRTSTK